MTATRIFSFNVCALEMCDYYESASLLSFRGANRVPNKPAFGLSGGRSDEESLPSKLLSYCHPERRVLREATDLFPVNSLFLYMGIAKTRNSCEFSRVTEKIPC